MLVPPNRLGSLSGDAAYISVFIQQRTSGPVVLVGHSYGGAVITNAAASDPDVKALVDVNGFAPDQGESTLQLANALPGSDLAGDPTTKFDFVAYPGAPAGDVDLYIKQTVFPHAFANDLPASTAAMLAASQRPITFSAAAEPSGLVLGTKAGRRGPRGGRRPAPATRATQASPTVTLAHLSEMLEAGFGDRPHGLLALPSDVPSEG